MQRLSLPRIIKAITAFLLLGISVYVTFMLADSLGSMHEFVVQDKAGVTDAALGAIFLIPLVVVMSLIIALSTFSAIVLVASVLVGRLPDSVEDRGRYRNRITVLAIIAVIILGVAIISLVSIAGVDTDIVWVAPGIILFGILVFVWVAIALAKVQVSRKLASTTTDSAPLP